MLDPILISGAPRSGTSLVANIVHHCGAVGGVVETNGMGEMQPTGFYENTELVTKVNKNTLWEMGCDPRGVKALPTNGQQGTDVSLLVFDIMRRQGVGIDTPWYFKDPKTLLLHTTYLRSFPSSPWVLVQRDREAIVDSCMRCPFMVGRKTRNEWMQYVKYFMRAMVRVQLATMNVRTVRYDDLISGNFERMREVIEWLGLRWNRQHVEETVIKR